MAEYRPPGVYIEEKNAFPGSAVAVETAIPAFIGYTEKAERNGKSLTGIPTKVTSFAEYAETFGLGYKHEFKLVENTKKDNTKVFKVNKKDYNVVATTSFMLFNSIRLFYQNGGADCFIVSVGEYAKTGVDAGRINDEKVWEALKREFEPTMVVIPDAVKVKDPGEFYGIYAAVLRHCDKVQSRFGIFDVPVTAERDDDNILNFRTGIGTSFLNYGAAYYPWLHTSIVPASEVNFLNLTEDSNDVATDIISQDDEKLAIEFAKLTDTAKGALKAEDAGKKKAFDSVKNQEQKNRIILACYDAKIDKDKKDDIEGKAADAKRTSDNEAAQTLNTNRLLAIEYIKLSIEERKKTTGETPKQKTAYEALPEADKQQVLAEVFNGKLEQEQEKDSEGKSALDNIRKANEPNRKSAVELATLNVPYIIALLKHLPEPDAKKVIEGQRLIICQKIAFNHALIAAVDSPSDITGKQVFELLYPQPDREMYRNRVQDCIKHLKKTKEEQKADEDGKSELRKLKDHEPTWASQVVAGTFDITKNDDQDPINVNFHQSLMACSPTYVQIMTELRAQLSTLPPSAAMAGIYTMVDNSRGVWKAPANVSLSSVSNPTSNITSEQQASYNVDPMTGKSINIIRPFRGIGTIVWGARTLDGNSQDWRYINVRRTLIMIEQSIKLAMRAYVFEPNTASTWITVQSMVSNFLTNMWKQGALAGAAPEQAFDVQIGLGTTMTPNDILDGKMLVTIRVAIARPAEFIILTFQQMQQQS